MTRSPRSGPSALPPDFNPLSLDDFGPIDDPGAWRARVYSYGPVVRDILARAYWHDFARREADRLAFDKEVFGSQADASDPKKSGWADGERF